jgi:rubrerythrin
MADLVIYDFYECEDCMLGYSVEENQIDEPTCPSCQCDRARFVTSRFINLSDTLSSVGNCVQCEKKADLVLEDNKYICQSCAQDQSDMAP